MKECSVRNSGATASQEMVHSLESTCSLNTQPTTTTTAHELEFTSIANQSQPALNELPIQTLQGLQHNISFNKQPTRASTSTGTTASTSLQREREHSRELPHHFREHAEVMPPLALLQSNGRAMNPNPLKVQGFLVSSGRAQGSMGSVDPLVLERMMPEVGSTDPFWGFGHVF